jgi:hypothetical protein
MIKYPKDFNIFQIHKYMQDEFINQVNTFTNRVKLYEMFLWNMGEDLTGYRKMIEAELNIKEEDFVKYLSKQ